MSTQLGHILERKIGADLALINRVKQTICILDDAGKQVWGLLKEIGGDFAELPVLVQIPADEEAAFHEFCAKLRGFVEGESGYQGPSLHRYFYDQGVPLVVGLEINTSCQLQCRHCYNAEREARVRPAPQSLILEEVGRLAAELEQLGTPFVVVTGGEPLLHPHALDICRVLRRHGLAVKLFSNGWLLTPSVARELGELGIYLAGFTLFGCDAADHEYISRRNGSFRRIVNAIKLCREHGVTTDATFFLMRHNFRRREEMKEWARRELGVKSSVSFSMTPREDGSQLPFDLEIGTREMEQFFREIGATKRGLDCGEECTIPCTAGKTLIAVKANGDVVPCISLLHPVGNIREQSFTEIWQQSSKLKRFRELQLKDIAGCSTCQTAGSCLRCFVNAQMLGNDVFGKDPHACRVTKAYLAAKEAGRR